MGKETESHRDRGPQAGSSSAPATLISRWCAPRLGRGVEEVDRLVDGGEEDRSSVRAIGNRSQTEPAGPDPRVE
jgi:hypothetical protein